MVKILVIVGLSILSGILYRMGGTGGKWYLNTKVRDIGCAVCGLAGMVVLFDNPWWIHVISGVALFGALTTYLDSIFGYDNFWVHGLIVGIAYLPYAIVGGAWIGFILRCAVISVAMGLVSKFSSKDTVEEVGRGSTIPATTPLFLI